MAATVGDFLALSFDAERECLALEPGCGAAPGSAATLPGRFSTFAGANATRHIISTA